MGKASLSQLMFGTPLPPCPTPSPGLMSYAYPGVTTCRVVGTYAILVLMAAINSFAVANVPVTST